MARLERAIFVPARHSMTSSLAAWMIWRDHMDRLHAEMWNAIMGASWDTFQRSIAPDPKDEP